MRLAILFATMLSISACSNSVSDAVQKGKDLMAKGELAAAVIEFKNAVQSDSSSIDARVALGEALERKGELAGAEQSYRKALELGGSADDLVPRIALILLDRGDSAILLKDFVNRELSQPESDSELRGIVALAEMALKHKDKAENQLAKAKTVTPAVRLARAQMAILESQPERAVNELAAVINEGKAPWWVLRAASRLYLARGDKDSALSAMKGAYELAGWNQGVIGEYAELLIGIGKYEEARPLRGKLWKIAPSYYRTAFVEALFRMQEGRFDEAHDAATKVLAALPEHIPAMMIAAKVELDRGELSSADSRLRKILFLTPYSIEALRMKLMLELRRDNLKEAAAVLSRALGQAPNDRHLLAISADIAWAKGDKTGAVRQLSTLSQVEPPSVEILTRLAEMKYSLGKHDDTVKLLDRAIELANGNLPQRETVFRALLRMRLIDQARKMAKVELERRPKEPEPYLWMAAVVGSEGNEAAALEQTNHALDIRADYYPALLALAKTTTTEERARQYDDRLKKAVDAGTKDARIYFDLARRMRIAGAEPDKIGALLERSVVADPASVGLRDAAIRHWLAWGKRDKALTLASGGESANPDNWAMKALAASTHEAAGNLEQAITKYAELNARFPERVDWGMKRAELQVRAGNTSEAIQSLRKLISQRTDEPAPYQMLAMLQVRQRLGNDALVTASMLADRPKLKSTGLLLQGDVLAQMEQDTKALKAYDEAAKAGATEAATLRKIELQARTLGEGYADAELRDWLAKHPDSMQGLALAIRVATVKGDYATAAKHLEAVDKLNPNNPATLNDLAWAYAQLKNPAALVLAVRANQLAPENPQILDTLAEAQTLAGKKKEAVASLRFGLALAPQHPVLKVHLAELLMEEGNKKEAAVLLDGIDQKVLSKESLARFERVKRSL